MKPIKLILNYIGPHKHTEIDFEALEDFFLIWLYTFSVMIASVIWKLFTYIYTPSSTPTHIYSLNDGNFR